MKILLSCLGKVVGQKGGIEKVLCNMANAMYERGHEVAIVTYENNSGKPFFFLNDAIEYYNPGLGKKDNRVIVNFCNIFTLDKHKREYRRMLNSAKFASVHVREVIDKFKPDIIITFELKSVVVYNEFIKPQIPIISMFHFNPEDVLENKYFYDSYVKSNCIQVLMESDVVKTKERLGIENVVWIPNVVPQYDCSAAVANKIIINVARIEPKQKRQHLLIKAFGRLKGKYPDWQIQFWGDNRVDKKYFEELKLLIKKYQLERQVKFCGTTNDIPNKLKAASIFAFPSAYEGFPLALTEAMSMGLPVIGFNNAPSVNQLILNNKNGFLVDENTEAFSIGLDKLMASEELRLKLGQNGKQGMREYSPEVVWLKWENLIKEIIDT